METANFMKLFYLIIIVSLDHTFCKDDVLVKSCPEDKANWDTAARRKECKPEGGRNYVYHCLKNEGQQLVETCLVAQWIEIGVCPVLFSGGNFGFENCTLIMLRTGGACPKTAYRSNELYSFPICFDINQPKATTTQSNTTTETTTMSVTPDTPGDGNINIGGIVAGVIVSLVLIGISIGIYLYKRRKDFSMLNMFNKGADVEHGQKRSDDKAPSNPNKQSDVQQEQGIEEEEVPLISKEESTEKPETGIVQLAAFDDGLDIVKKHGILIITGQIGSGKTTAMKRIIQLLKEENRKWKVKDISFLTLGGGKSSNDKLLIKWDDCFGKFVTNPVKKENTLEMLKEICKWVAGDDENRKLILTMRHNEFVSFNLNDSDWFRTKDKSAHYNVCLDYLKEREEDSLEEKELLAAGISKEVCSCDESSDIHNTNVITKELMDETESVKFSALGWPLICRLARIPYIAKNLNFFKKDPVRCVMSLFDTLKSKNQQLYCAMIYVLFKGDNICRTDAAFLKEINEQLAPAQDGETFVGSGNNERTDNPVTLSRNELISILYTHPHYFVEKDKECFEFHHEIFVLWLLCHFYQRFPETTIEHFDLDILIELLRPNDYSVERYEDDIGMLCSFDSSVPEEKHGNPAELGGDGDKKPVQCEEDIEQRAGIQTISSKTLKQTEEGKSENQSWKFTLEEEMFSCFIQRVIKEKEEVQKLQVEKEQKYGILEGHPLLEDSTFMRIFSPEEAMTSVQG